MLGRTRIDTRPPKWFLLNGHASSWWCEAFVVMGSPGRSDQGAHKGRPYNHDEASM